MFTHIKKNRNKKFILGPICVLLIFFLSISASLLEANSDPEVFLEMRISSTPNPVGSGARALGMGGSFISIADDATAASWNPAALIILKRSEISCVISHDYGRRAYDTSSVSGKIDDLSNEEFHLNYLSFAVPFSLFSRLMVFSLNYQHLYEFSYEEQSQWIDQEQVWHTMQFSLNEKQRGALEPFSPALAIQVLPSLSFGITANIWSNELFTNYWENISTLYGKGIELGYPTRSFAQLYERYEFSGFNLHCGFLWHVNRTFRVGGVVKTPFRARVDHTIKYISLAENLADIADREYILFSDDSRFKLNMPVSYGIGTALGFLDNDLLFSLDIYRTHWDKYLMITPSSRRSPINYKLENEANIKPTTQVRLGSEYLIYQKAHLFPLRAGIFYDPEPAEGKVDDFFGVSIGTGIVFENYVFDIAYQYRFGEKRGTESMLERKITAKVKQHSFYSSMIIYF